MRIRIQFWIQDFDDQILKKFKAEKNLYFFIQNCNLLIPRQEKPSALNREHPAIQNMKFLYFFLLLWVIFAHLDPDPATQINAVPDPQPCFFKILADFLFGSLGAGGRDGAAEDDSRPPSHGSQREGLALLAPPRD
jgi:hypothetical protein